MPVVLQARFGDGRVCTECVSFKECATACLSCLYVCGWDAGCGQMPSWSGARRVDCSWECNARGMMEVVDWESVVVCPPSVTP
jgi:hypothetical protein